MANSMSMIWMRIFLMKIFLINGIAYIILMKMVHIGFTKVIVLVITKLRVRIPIKTGN